MLVRVGVGTRSGGAGINASDTREGYAAADQSRRHERARTRNAAWMLQGSDRSVDEKARLRRWKARRDSRSERASDPAGAWRLALSLP